MKSFFLYFNLAERKEMTDIVQIIWIIDYFYNNFYQRIYFACPLHFFNLKTYVYLILDVT